MAAREGQTIRNIWREHVLSYVNGEGERHEGGMDASSAFLLHFANMNRKPTLDVDIVSHCNLNCVSCCHLSPLAEPHFLSLDEYGRDLRMLAEIEGVGSFFDAICLMGGEPLLHPNVADFVRITHELLPDAKVRLVTNGLLVHDAPEELWDTMRTVGAELLATPYPVGIDYDELATYVREKGVTSYVGGGLAVNEDGQSYFLKTLLDDSGCHDATQAFVDCPLAGVTMQLLDGRIYPCNRGAFLDRLNRRFGTSFAHEEGDYLELSSIGSVAEIDCFRRSPKPMCRYCECTDTEVVHWGRSTRSADEWIAAIHAEGRECEL